MTIFSVVTPTYNRADLIGRVFSSLMEQEFKDFEWVVIDDGSTDNTESLIKEYINEAFFRIKYIKTSNQGKALALNESVKHCSGILYLVFDSDDWCDANALSVFYDEYKKLQLRSDFNNYCALSCLKRYATGETVGDTYNNLDKYGFSYIDRVNRKVKGDKWECLLLNRITGLNYPVSNGDKYMAPGYIWLILADKGYKTVFIDKSLSTIEYQSDGISKNNFSNRYRSIQSTIAFYKKAKALNGFSFSSKSRYYINYIRFSLHAQEKPDISIMCVFLFSIGLFIYLFDKKRHGL